MDFATWTAYVKSIGGVPVTWPFPDSNYGQPAARFDANGLAIAQQDGSIGLQTEQATGDGTYTYVLYTNVTGTPHLMTAFESAENTVFTAGDSAANSLGLPSLNALSTGLKVAGALVVGVVVIGLIGYANKIRPS